MTMPGRAIGEDHQQGQGLAAEEAVALDGERQQGAEHQGDQGRAEAALTEVHRAARAPGLSQALAHHSVVKPAGGQTDTRAGLKELISTTSRGT